MKLLFITRRVDRSHPLAGFAWEWVREFSRQLSEGGGRLTGITLESSASEGLTEEVIIRSVRKTEKNRFKDFFTFCRLLKSLVPQSDAIFVHQHPIYAIIAASFAKLFRKKIYLWYVHKKVDFRLRIAAALCNGIFTASKESFRLKTKRPISIVGHGIDTALFCPADQRGDLRRSTQIEVGQKFIILSIGRISPVKGYAVLIDAVQSAVQQCNNLTVRIVGRPGLKEHAGYENELKKSVHEKGLDQVIRFIGPVAHHDIVVEYRNANVFINLSGTGSLDKAVLEAMACGVPVITSNEAFQGLLSQIDNNLFVACAPRAVAMAMLRIINMPPEARRQIGGALRAIVVRDHDLKQLVARILSRL